MEGLSQTDSNTNILSFYSYGISSKQHELEINGAIKILIQQA